MIINLDFILCLTKGTMLYQYFSILYTLQFDFDRLSRVQIISSFFDGVSNFSVVELLIGQSFSESVFQNNYFLGYSYWMHNDFAAIFYSYGALGLLIFFIYWYFFISNVFMRSKENAIRILPVSMFFFSFLNGIVYHPTIIFILLIYSLSNRSANCNLFDKNKKS